MYQLKSGKPKTFKGQATIVKTMIVIGLSVVVGIYAVATLQDNLDVGSFSTSTQTKINDSYDLTYVGLGLAAIVIIALAASAVINAFS